MDTDELTALLSGPGREAELVERLSALTEAQRRKLAPTVRRMSDWSFTGRHDDTALALAVLGTLGGVRKIARALPTHGTDTSLLPSLAVRVLRDRAPHWLPDLPDAMLDNEFSDWGILRALVRAGLVARPDHAGYYLGAVNGVRARGPVLTDRSAIDGLRLDPGFLDEELWILLETEVAGRRLGTSDGWDDKPYRHPGGPAPVPRPERTWRHALVTLAAEGAIDRDRLLDVVLTAPLRDWKPVDVTWFVGLHDALDPTHDEVAARQATYARWLAAEHGPAVKAAQKLLTRLLGDPRFEPEPVLRASRATLGRSDKASAAAQLRLLAALGRRHPDLDVAGVVTVALDHPRADVREQAARTLTGLGVAAPAAVLEPFTAPAPEPRPAPVTVTPVATPDELADLLLRLVEEADDPVELERAVDGLLRFAGQRPTHADVLERRVGEAELHQGDLRLAVATLVHAWLAPRRRWRVEHVDISLAHSHIGSRPAAAHTLPGVAARRLSDVLRTVRHGPVAGLALPSYADGSIDPADLVDRLERMGRMSRDEPPAYDTELAVLRVAPDRLGELDVPRSGATGRTVHRAVRRVTERVPRWQREVREIPGHRHWTPDRTFVTFVDPASLPAADGPVDGLFARAAPWRTIADEYQFGEYEPRFDLTVAFCALMLPHHPDVLAAHAHALLRRDLDKDRGVSGPVLDALGRAARRNGAPESSAVVLGLAAKDARVRTAAQDALLDLARHGLLDGEGLGRQAAAHLADGLVVGQRVSAGLAEVARADDAAVLPLLVALEQLLPVLPARRDAGAYVELAASLVERTRRPLTLPDELRALAAGRSGSVLAKAARRLVAPG